MPRRVRYYIRKGSAAPDRFHPHHCPTSQSPRLLAPTQGVSYGPADACIDDPNPEALPGTASGHEAARAMQDAEIGDVMVITHNQVCGMVTDRDIVVRMVAEAQARATTTLADLCRHSCVTVTPTDSLEQAVRLMRTHAIRRVPVVDGGQPVGMVSLGDLAVAREPDAALGEMSGAPPHA